MLHALAQKVACDTALRCLVKALGRTLEDHLVGHALQHQTGIRMTAVRRQTLGQGLHALVTQQRESWRGFDKDYWRFEQLLELRTMLVALDVGLVEQRLIRCVGQVVLQMLAHVLQIQRLTIGGQKFGAVVCTFGGALQERVSIS